MVLIGLLKHVEKMLKIQNLIFENLSFRKNSYGLFKTFSPTVFYQLPNPHAPLPFGKSKFNLFEA